ncbi:hypothetical protein ABT071_36255 [Streptomyces sp. NPDC002506]|uniref:hypothetical protein n=1 Tax=Streptomyces sp. NPDC002506 TaxID=3154536 RepID=UPI00332B5994
MAGHGEQGVRHVAEQCHGGARLDGAEVHGQDCGQALVFSGDVGVVLVMARGHARGHDEGGLIDQTQAAERRDRSGAAFERGRATRSARSRFSHRCRPGC